MKASPILRDEKISAGQAAVGAATAAIPQHSHVVQFYEDDQFLVESIGRFLGPALASGEAAVLAATPEHCAQVVDELERRGVDAVGATHDGRFVRLDAAEMLERFLIEGWPDETKFREVVGGLLEKTRERAGHGRVTVYGEMVALLWTAGRREAAIQLEQYWNRLADTQSFELLCGYPMGAFEREEDREMFFSVCGAHSDVTPTEGFPAQGTDKQRRQSVAQLQQRTRALEHEIRISQERVLLLQSAAKAGTWEMDMHEERFTLSTKAAQILGLQGRHIALGELVERMYFGGDRDQFLAALKRARTGRKEFVVEFRVHREDEFRMLSMRGKTLFNGGHPLMLGILSDVTPAREGF